MAFLILFIGNGNITFFRDNKFVRLGAKCAFRKPNPLQLVAGH